MNIKISEKLAKLLKEAKVKLMVGGILGTMAISGGVVTTSYAQDNNGVSNEIEYNDDITIDPALFNDDVTINSSDDIYSKYEYAEQLRDYVDGKLTLREATHTGGATQFLYDAIARGISMETGLDFDMVKDTIINLNLDLIAGTDSEQMDILYPEGYSYRKLEESTDNVLTNVKDIGYFALSSFAGTEIDHDVLLALDNKYFENQNIISTTSYDCNELKKCLNFFLANGEINGYKFEQLSDGGKKLVLVSYDRFRNLISKNYKEFVTNGVAIADDYSKIYQMTDSMNILSVATYLESTNLINGYYNLLSQCLNSNQSINFDIANNLDQNVGRIELSNELKNLNINEELIKSTLFVTNLNNLSVGNVAYNFDKNIDIHTEYENMKQYLNSVLQHNATNDISKSISLVNVCAESDKYDIALLESYYNTLKFELDTKQVDFKHVSAVLRWVLDYYNGFYIDNPGTEVRYMEHLTDGGMIIADNILNQYKMLGKNMYTSNPETNNLIEQVNNINLWQETKAAEQIMYSNFEQLQQSLNYYTVQKGDTLSKISRMYNVSVKDLVELNGIENPDLIYPDQVFKTNASYDYDQQFRK